jgi:hypothetical protein
VLRLPLFGRPGSFLVGTDDGTVEKRHAQRDATFLSTGQQALPHAQLGPADEGLGGHPPRPEISRDGSPLGSILVAPDDGLDGAPQIVMLRLALWAAFFNQRRQHSPLHLRQNCHRTLLCKEWGR